LHILVIRECTGCKKTPELGDFFNVFRAENRAY
jgi:hypothetical protein